MRPYYAHVVCVELAEGGHALGNRTFDSLKRDSTAGSYSGFYLHLFYYEDSKKKTHKLFNVICHLSKNTRFALTFSLLQIRLEKVLI